jgi:hypothetical protein
VRNFLCVYRCIGPKMEGGSMLSMRRDGGRGLYCLLFGGGQIGEGKLVGGRLESNG